MGFQALARTPVLEGWGAIVPRLNLPFILKRIIAGRGGARSRSHTDNVPRFGTAPPARDGYSVGGAPRALLERKGEGGRGGGGPGEGGRWSKGEPPPAGMKIKATPPPPDDEMTMTKFGGQFWLILTTFDA